MNKHFQLKQYGALAFVAFIAFTIFIYARSDIRILPHAFFDKREIEYDSERSLFLRGFVTKHKGERKGNVLFLHGTGRYGCGLPLYRVIIREIATHGYDVASFDFRGYGDSDLPQDQTVDAFDLRNDITMITEKLGWDGYSIVAHSLGASTALNYLADTRDQRVKVLVLVGPARRVYERFLKPDAPDYQYAKSRFIRVNSIKGDFPEGIIRKRLELLNIDTAIPYLSDSGHVPIFFSDGGDELALDQTYLYDYFNKISGPKKYVTYAGADHYFYVKSLRHDVRISYKKHFDIIWYKQSVVEPFLNDTIQFLNMVSE